MSTPTVSTIIAGMRSRLGSPASWTKGFAARTSDGTACDPSSPDAVCWCLTGALARECPGHLVETVTRLLLSTLDRGALNCLEPFNDGRFTSHTDVLDLLDQALSIASR